MTFFMKTKNGYTVDEVISALQKDIRRGKEEDAMFWALELCPKYENYMWKRLLVVAYEDISALAPGNIPLAVSKMRDDYFAYREVGDTAALLVIANAILLMCRAQKCRIADNFLVTMADMIDEGMRLDIPDYAHDMHTRHGRHLRRGGEHFAEEGTKLAEPLADVHDPYAKEFKKILPQKKKFPSLSWIR
ncbi:hypothetical protein ACFL2D_02865, partial [Patescibacteria group bacterium]